MSPNAVDTGSTTKSPNFTASHSVLLDHPISIVFEILGTTKGHERVCKLSSLCSSFELLEHDEVALADNAKLAESSVRTLPAHTTLPTGASISADGASHAQADVKPATEAANPRLLPRQAFKMQEVVPVLFGVIKTTVDLSGTLTWDEYARVALYETISNQGIVTWKVRVFEEEEGGKKTRVNERIEGWCPGWMKMIVQSEASKSHKAHMEQYHTLF
ncbi:hypothetical protein BDQ12DRAFT_236286 [Crucibulum laeve]|uniref:Bet v1-like protein n=1 Tax=Crucibulum laeve TaxID=68775 RepID=A0A5C3LU64_9AGAR|nr:hypothetical protein BDQ12DRAFT_236286 [Crucibulum laeve]